MHPHPNLRHPQDSTEQRATEGLGALQTFVAGLGVRHRIRRDRAGIRHLSGTVVGVEICTYGAAGRSFDAVLKSKKAEDESPFWAPFIVRTFIAHVK